MPFRSAKLLIRHSVVKRSTLVDLREDFLDEPRAMLGACHVERRAAAEALKPVAQPRHRLLLVTERGRRLRNDARETDRLVGFLLRQAFMRLTTMTQRTTRNDESQLVGFQTALDSRSITETSTRALASSARSAPIGHGSPAAVRES